MASRYDEEFDYYLRLAKKLMSKLDSGNDVRICKRWISKLCNLSSEDVAVKKNRNHFFKYMLHVLHDGTLEGPFQELPDDENLHGDGSACLCGGDSSKDESKPRFAPIMRHWSKDKRTYIAAKALPGAGALIYMAVTKDPSKGWDIPGEKGNE